MCLSEDYRYGCSRVVLNLLVVCCARSGPWEMKLVSKGGALVASVVLI